MKFTIAVTVAFLCMAILYMIIEGITGFINITIIWAVWFVLFGSDFIIKGDKQWLKKQMHL